MTARYRPPPFAFGKWPKMRLKADLVLLLVAILWGSAFAAQRIAGQLGSVHLFQCGPISFGRSASPPVCAEVAVDQSPGGLDLWGRAGPLCR